MPFPQQLSQSTVDTQLTPQPVQQMHPAQGSAGGHCQAREPVVASTAVGVRVRMIAQIPRQARDQPAQPVLVEPVLSRPRFSSTSACDTPVDLHVVGQGQVPHRATVLVGPCRAPQVHAYQPDPEGGKIKITKGESCAYHFPAPCPPPNPP